MPALRRADWDGGTPAGRQPQEPAGGAVAVLVLGLFGAHRFYVGKIGTGILQILTLGGLGIWTFVDFIIIIVGHFKDKQGRRVSVWTD